MSLMSLSPNPSLLFGDLDVDATPDAPIGAMTWYGIGGRADVLIRPRTMEALATLVKRCERSGAPVRVLGEGANLLVADEGIDGVVVKLDEPVFREIKYNPDGAVNRMKAMAGADLAKTLMDTARRGLGGLIHMAGIPASVGGALKMNAGGAFGTVSDHLESVTCINRAGEIVTYPKSELRFEYRASNIPDPVILSAIFQVTEDDPIALRERVKEIFAFKKSTQPLADHSAGCTFKNAIDPVTEQRIPAGKLIDEAGLKGQTIGGASVSPHHANFITVEPSATANDVLQLMNLIQKRVFENSGIELQREVAVWQRSSAHTA